MAMNGGDLPSISGSTRMAHAYSLDGETPWGAAMMTDSAAGAAPPPSMRRLMAARAQPVQLHQEIEMPATCRLIEVVVVDPTDHVPLADRLLYQGERKLTDLTDQELFFEIDINAILKAHNEKRVKIVNKAVKDRTEYLEPARIRDLKMNVVTIATF